MAGHIFISHSNRDDDLVTALSQALDSYGSSVWADHRDLAPGDLLSEEIRDAIDDADSVLAVLSPQAFNSKWMRIEIDCALAIGRRVIPLLIAPMEVSSLAHFFGDDLDAEPGALTFDPERERLDDLLPRLRVALGELAPDVPEPVAQPAPAPLAELIVRLDDPEIDETGGERRARATATLRYVPPAGSGQREVESRRFDVRAPIGPIEAGELAWYLERFAVWPSAIFRDRAEAVETQLAQWGRALHDALDTGAGRKAWEDFAPRHQRSSARSRSASIQTPPKAQTTSSPQRSRRRLPYSSACRGSCSTTARATSPPASALCGCAGACPTAKRPLPWSRRRQCASWWSARAPRTSG